MESVANNCRVCLKLNENIFSIFKKKDGRYLPRIIYNISGVNVIQILEPDAKICDDCASAAVNAEAIILRCQESQQYLDYLKSQASKNASQKTLCGTVPEGSKTNLKIEEHGLGQDDNILHSNISKMTKIEDTNFCPPPPKSGNATKRGRPKLKAEEVKFQCEQCDFTTKTGKLFLAHRKDAHNIDDPNIYLCTHCSKRFSWKPRLYRHIQQEHHLMPVEKKFLCNQCGRAYTREAHLVEHVKQRHGPRRYKCADPNCDQTFTRLFTLRRHFLAAHSTISRYHCTDCDKYFKIYDLWKYHNEVVHKNEMVFCPRCGYAFRLKEKLEEHLQKDVCKRSIIPCPFCQRRFTTRGGLREHLKNIHHLV